MSRVIVSLSGPSSYAVTDPTRNGRTWHIELQERPDGSCIVRSDDDTASIFTPLESDPELLYKIVKVPSNGSMSNTTVESDLPERYSIGEDHGASIDTYESRYPAAPQATAELLTWYTPKRRKDALALIHALEHLWVTAPKRTAAPSPRLPEDSSIIVDATSFSQHGKQFLMFSDDVRSLLRYVEVKPNTEEHPDYPQRAIDNRRLKRIGDYVMTDNGFLLPSIIINFYDTIEVERLGRNKTRIRIPNDEQKHAYCLDGQHRLFTFDEDENPMIAEFADKGAYELPVIAMLNQPRTMWHDQFVVINTEQRPVNKNQILSMEQHFHSDRLSQEEATAVRIVEALNQRPTCVLYRKVFVRSGDRSTIVKLKNLTKLIERHFDPNGTFRRSGTPLTEEELIELMEGYVNAIHDIFEEEWDSSTHVLTKTAGWESLFSSNGVLPIAYGRAGRRINPKTPKLNGRGSCGRSAGLK